MRCDTQALQHLHVPAPSQTHALPMTDQPRKEPPWGAIDVPIGFGADSFPGRIMFFRDRAIATVPSKPDVTWTITRRPLLVGIRAPRTVDKSMIFLPTEEDEAGISIEAEPRQVEALLVWLPDADILSAVLGVEVAQAERQFPRGLLYALIGKHFASDMPGCGLALLDGSPGNSGDVLFQFAQKNAELDEGTKKELDYCESWLSAMHQYNQVRSGGKFPWPLPLGVPPKVLQQQKQPAAVLDVQVPADKRASQLLPGKLELFGVGAVLSWADRTVFWPRDIAFELFLPQAGKTPKSPVVIKAPYGGAPFWILLPMPAALQLSDWAAPAAKREEHPEMTSPWFSFQDAHRRR